MFKLYGTRVIGPSIKLKYIYIDISNDSIKLIFTQICCDGFLDCSLCWKETQIGSMWVETIMR